MSFFPDGQTISLLEVIRVVEVVKVITYGGWVRMVEVIRMVEVVYRYEGNLGVKGPNKRSIKKTLASV